MPGSVRFTTLERDLDGLPPDPLAEAVCKFHIADGVGCGVDKRYGETFVFDRLLRLIRRHFDFCFKALIDYFNAYSLLLLSILGPQKQPTAMILRRFDFMLQRRFEVFFSAFLSTEL